LVAFLEYAQKFFGPIKELGSYYSVMQSAMASSERLFALLDIRPEIVSPAAPAVLPSRRDGAAGEVVFDDVHFRYPGGGEVLSGLSFSVAPGEKVALVGSTGAGKTTIVRLLIRLYDVDPAPSGSTESTSASSIRASCAVGSAWCFRITSSSRAP